MVFRRASGCKRQNFSYIPYSFTHKVKEVTRELKLAKNYLRDAARSRLYFKVPTSLRDIAFLILGTKAVIRLGCT